MTKEQRCVIAEVVDTHFCKHHMSEFMCALKHWQKCCSFICDYMILTGVEENQTKNIFINKKSTDKKKEEVSRATIDNQKDLK